MSGAEVAGLVLGAIPLLISALEHWQSTSAVLAKWWHLQSSLKLDLEKLEDTRVLYNSHLEELLRPLMIDGVLTEAAFESMRSELSDDMWKKERVQLALRQRLGERYDRYTAKVVSMGDSIKAYTETLFENDPAFQAELKRRWQKVVPATAQSSKPLASATTPVSTALSKRTIGTVFRFEGRRLKYSLPSKRRDDLLLEMDDCLAKLEKFLASSDRISPLVLQQTRYQGPLSARALSNFWNHAGAVFNLLGEAWQCQCKRYHCACLWLKHRTTDTIELKIQLRYCHETSPASPPWLRRDTHVKLVGSRPVKLTTGSLVTIQYPPSSSSAAVGMASQTAVSKPVPLKLQGLCKTAAHDHPCDTCLGALEGDEHNYELFAATAPSNAPTDATTLADLISQGHFHTFTPAKRFEIALTLASSHLQLYSTPWLRTQWTSHDIHMSASSQQGVWTIADGPYVLARFADNGQIAKSDSDRHLSLGALGIALMEICFCTVLENTTIAQRPDFAVLLANKNIAISSAIRLAVAGQWFGNGDEVRQQVGDAYMSAVDWALHHSSIKADDDTWRRDFLDNVVQPLQDTYNMLFEQRPKK